MATIFSYRTHNLLGLKIRQSANRQYNIQAKYATSQQGTSSLNVAMIPCNHGETTLRRY